jgi:lysophospholipase L1-like esterase
MAAISSAIFFSASAGLGGCAAGLSCERATWMSEIAISDARAVRPNFMIFPFPLKMLFSGQEYTAILCGSVIMRIVLHSCALAVMILLGCAHSMSSHSLRFLALGDSYTIGESVDAKDRWPVQLATKLRESGIDIGDPQVIAVTGWTTDELSAGIDSANPQGPYQLVTLLIGVNNQYRGRTVEEFRGQFVSLLKRATGLAGNDSKRVIVVSIPDWGATPFANGRDRAKIAAEMDRFNEVCRDEAAAAGARHVDVTAISRHVADDPSLVAGDGLHPSGKMYKQWTERLLRETSAALKSGE